MIVSVLTLACACSSTSWLAGDPDPGHRSLSALEPVLSVIPAGAHVIHENRVDSRWDSCDGRSSSYGWDPVTVIAGFTTGKTPRQVIARARGVMGQLGWSYDAKNSHDGTWVWSRPINGRMAATTLQVENFVNPHLWSLDADAPPATHPVTGC